MLKPELAKQILYFSIPQAPKQCIPFIHVKLLTGNTRNSAIIWALVQIARLIFPT